MKKLMLAIALICATTLANAAAFQWATKSTGSTGVLYAGNTTDKAYSAYGAITLYLFDAATYDQATAFADLKDGTFTGNKNVDTTTLSSASKIAAKGYTYGTAGESYDFYFAAVLDDSTFYISSMMTDKAALVSGTTSMTWADVQATSQAKLDASAGFMGAGLYETVPEPTSGLLLLLGMAGLALRRKQA